MLGRTNGLVLLLRGLSIVNLAAVVAVMAPNTWLSTCHEWLGLGAFPAGPITAYLARSTSLWFASFGVLLGMISRDVVRHAWLISFIGWAMAIQGIAMIVIDYHEGLPVWWIAVEGPSCMGLGCLMLTLQCEP